ncbi:MAG: hypothetical protein RL577_1074 [Bacteroidota bacterium]
MPRWMFVTALFWVGCQSAEDKKSIFNDQWSVYTKDLYKQVLELDKTQPGSYKTVIKGDDIHTEELDSCDFAQEFAVFLNYDLALAEKRFGTYRQTLDSSQGLSLLRFECSDTAADLRQFQVLKKQGQVQLLEWDIQTHSFLMDRAMKLSVQPGKGYRIWVKENSLWASPNEYEIFTELHNPEHLQTR